ncbi:glucan 1,4-alpha-glucosidase [Amycolatopsis magusensis]|uniref:alpha-amylase n=1 Tax=Amycolatopsis magusensis TaxID=882444 RepID=A0ABS4PQX8_9PSEU|nr:glucan 1,4-alpha-glucosidase [Amycolatopsis magusensis]MBP2181723.1 glucoamylase [Amycolatopsis magusensis]
MTRSRMRTAATLLSFSLLALPAHAASAAAEAPGAPGTGAAWTTGGKEGFGTSATTASKVWFTLGQGISHEVYYPTVDVANVQDLQYVVSDGAGFTQLERDHTTKQVVLTDPRSLSYRQVNTAANGRYRITKTHTADPARATVLVQTRFEVLSGGPLQLYALYNPSLNNSGMGDTGATSGGQLVASDGPVSSALAASTGFTKLTSGYSGSASDGYVDLSGNHALDTQYDSASTPGNLVQLGQIPVGTDTTFTLALGFGDNRGAASANASASLAGGFAAADTAYRSGWNAYLSSLDAVPGSITGGGLTTQYNVALMTLKAHEDKTYLGANVASLTNPWGEAKDGNGTGDCGYHAVWSRDLYQVSTAQIAAGDTAAANRSADYLFNVQQRPDGSFPQNTRLDGTNCWTSLQLDEVAFPIVLVWQLNRFDAAMWAKVKKSADFLVSRGPSTPQERWEENGGYSPSTIAAEIAGLICAADIAERNGDTASANTYRTTADQWQAQVSGWTFTTSGPLGDGRYFERIDGNGNPNDGQNIFIQNGGGNHDERSIIDAGFLELVRLGVKPPADPDVAASLPEVDSTLKVTTPNGPMWYRYNHDGYGETASGGPYTGAGVGRLWPLLTGERGEYELANGRSATTHLTTMAAAANPGYLIPEQVWDRASTGGFTFGEGTGSATPLAWSMAQFVRLAHSIDAGAPVETPSVVKQRYANGCANASANFSVHATTTWGQSLFVVGDRPELGSWNPANAVPLSSASYPLWTATVGVPKGTAFQYKYLRKEGGAVTWESGANRAATATGCALGLNDTWRS